MKSSCGDPTGEGAGDLWFSRTFFVGSESGIPGRGGVLQQDFMTSSLGKQRKAIDTWAMSSLPGIVLPACPGHEHGDQNSFEAIQQHPVLPPAFRGSS